MSSVAHGLPQDQICKQGDAKPTAEPRMCPSGCQCGWAMHCVGNHWCSAGRKSGGHQSLLTSKTTLDTHSSMAQHLPLLPLFQPDLKKDTWCQKKHIKLSRMINIHDKEKCHWVKTKCEVEIKGIIHSFFTRELVSYCSVVVHMQLQNLFFSSHCRDRLWSYCPNWLPSFKVSISANSVIEVCKELGFLLEFHFVDAFIPPL